MKTLRPVPLGDAGPQRGVRIQPLPRGRAGQQPEEDVQVGEGGQDFLDAHDGDQGLRQGQAHPPVALRLHDHNRSGVGDSEVGPGDGHLGPQELLPQMEPGRFGQVTRVVGESLGGRSAPLPHLPPEDLTDLGAAPVDGRYEDVRGRSPLNCTISSARSVS